MNSLAREAGLVLAVITLLFGCGDPLRGPRPDSSITVDGSTGDGGTDGGGGDATVTDSTVRTDTSPPVDSAVTGDGSTPGLGQCAPSCLAMTGAVCCTFCGACNTAVVSCDPFCEEGQRWDCELECCFDTSAGTCVE